MARGPTEVSHADNVGDYLISARSFREYEAMFALTEDDLRGHVLDCPGGASSFVTAATKLGAHAIAVDPVYTVPPTALQQLVVAEQDRGSAHTRAGLDRYLWDFYGDPDGHRQMRRDSATLFAQDLEEHAERYVAASLPHLPFQDDQFDLVLSSHFLFTYVDRLSFDFHCRSLLEMQRVCRGEVRVFPLLDQAGRSLDSMSRGLLEFLDETGIRAEICKVAYEFQRGGNHMLVLSQ